MLLCITIISVNKMWIFRLTTQELRTGISSLRNSFPDDDDYAIYEIVKKMDDIHFDYRRRTYIPGQEDKAYFFELFKSKADQCLEQRKYNSMIEYAIRNSRKIMKVVWQNQEMVLHAGLERKLIEYIQHYYYFFDSYTAKTDVYIDVLREDDLCTSKSMDFINSVTLSLCRLAENVPAFSRLLTVAELSKQLNSDSEEMQSVLELYEEYGLISLSDPPYIAFTERAKRVLF